MNSYTLSTRKLTDDNHQEILIESMLESYLLAGVFPKTVIVPERLTKIDNWAYFVVCPFIPEIKYTNKKDNMILFVLKDDLVGITPLDLSNYKDILTFPLEVETEIEDL